MTTWYVVSEVRHMPHVYTRTNGTIIYFIIAMYAGKCFMGVLMSFLTSNIGELLYSFVRILG